MGKRSFLLVMVVGFVLAMGVFAGQLKAEIALEDTSYVAAHNASITADEVASSCNPNTGYATFNIALDNDALNDGAVAFGPWEIHLIPQGGAKANCFSSASTLQMSGTFVVTPEDPVYTISYNWDGYADLDPENDSAYAMVCATLDEAFDEFRNNIPVCRDTLGIGEDDCLPGLI